MEQNLNKIIDLTNDIDMELDEIIDKIRMIAQDTKDSFTNWRETHFEIARLIFETVIKEDDFQRRMEKKFSLEEHHMSLHEFALTLTDEFETVNKGKEWDGDYFDALEVFTNEKFK